MMLLIILLLLLLLIMLMTEQLNVADKTSGVQNWNGCKIGTNGNNLKFKPLHIFDCCERKKIN